MDSFVSEPSDPLIEAPWTESVGALKAVIPSAPLFHRSGPDQPG
jgi:hypothetical protein